ncbi:hypothetical protein IV203_020225 [Nitzschia inconspicua]|uniref:CHCH domain-containing protein n=1 Tax=Nitzschia inconspicua TaxID=303405 RepID=A0A9K3K780_9STRA|nr:hypothetical protein IV203_020225 [Nitzschia inconspicua]
MARSRRGGGMASRPAPRSAPAPPQSRPHSTQAQQPHTTPAPMQSHPPAAPSSGGGGMLSGIGSTIAQGMAFGTGSAIAHRAVGAVAESFGGGGSSGQQQQPMESAAANQVQQPQLSGACANDKQMFYECLQQNKSDQQACNFLYEQLKQCQAESTSMSFQ